MKLSLTPAMNGLFFFCVLFILPSCRSYPLCTDSRAPAALEKRLSFCGYSGSSCCDAAADAALQRQFAAMSISDPACAAAVKSVLCVRCNPYSADLLGAGAGIREVPPLCNSSSPASSAPSSKSSSDGFCTEVWNACRNATVNNSPFKPLMKGSAALPVSASKLSDSWQSAGDFCSSFGTTDLSACFDGNGAVFNTTPAAAPAKGICLERIGQGSYLNMAGFPTGSNRALFATQAGKIYVGMIPAQGSGKAMELPVWNPFIDLTDEVFFDTEFGMMGLALHPNFSANGRFFVSYNCDKTKSPGCAGRCSCNSEVGCEPSKLAPDNGSPPCQYHSVVAEYSAGGSSSDPLTMANADPNEVRRVFTMGLPFTSHHGGQILFGPADGYLYLMMGDGGGKGDPYGFSQNKKSLLGKIMRLDVDNVPSQAEISKLNLWGNYSIPRDNPYVDDASLQPEIWALGMRNPWRCSFDSRKPSYFYCGDDGEDKYEEVDLISKDGNYGWNIYEGRLLFNPPPSNVSLESLNLIFPVMGYNHSTVNKNIGSASIIGGNVYRGSTDPCLYGRYLYADLYATVFFAGTETPEGSGNYTSAPLPFACSKSSPIACDEVPGSSVPALGFIYSFSEDNKGDMYVLTSKGVYRVVRPSLCGFACATETPATDNATAPPPGAAPSAATASVFFQPATLLLALLLALLCWSL